MILLAIQNETSLPTFDEVSRVLLLRDYNTMLAVISTAVLGAAAGLVGSFLLLRKRSLMGDALSHATLPGIALAFIAMVLCGGEGKFLPGLLAGGAMAGLLGVGSVIAIVRWTRLKSDAALGIVLSVFFGLGTALLGLIQKMPGGQAAGLETYIYGSTATIVLADCLLIVAVACLALFGSIALFKEFSLICFDDAFAGAQGWPVALLDMVMLGLVTAVTVVGLQAVGLILIIAMLIIPPAAARFWTERLGRMMIIAAIVGAVSGWLGSSASALFDKLPAGAVIVIVAASVFAFSLIFGVRRGVVVRLWRHRQLSASVGRQHLLRALYERLEKAAKSSKPGHVGVSEGDLMRSRTWSRFRLRSLIRAARRDNLATRGVDGEVRLTEVGEREAARVVRNHRLWEMYLITHADVAPSHVDRDADMIEHVLDAPMIAKLERLLEARDTRERVPTSPHAI